MGAGGGARLVPAMRWLVLAWALAVPIAALSSGRVQPSQLPLKTSGRWIVDQNGDKIRLVCINWAGHLEALMPEGLAARPVDELAQFIADMGFNCVRLTYSVETVLRRDQPASLATGEVLTAATMQGLRHNNAWALASTVWEVFDRTIQALAKARLMVIMDNHVTQVSCAACYSHAWGLH